MDRGGRRSSRGDPGEGAEDERVRGMARAVSCAPVLLCLKQLARSRLMTLRNLGTLQDAGDVFGRNFSSPGR